MKKFILTFLIAIVIGCSCSELNEPLADITKSDDLKNVLKNIFPNKKIEGFNSFDDIEPFENTLKTGLIIMKGKSRNSGSGHVWVAEKYKYLSRTVRHYFDGVYSHTDHSLNKDAYMNWGWYGIGNGYYSLMYYKKTFYIHDAGDTYEDIKILTIQ